MYKKLYLTITFIIASLLMFPVTSVAVTTTDTSLWSAMIYYANTAKETFGGILSGNFSRAGENIYSVELEYTLSQKHWLTDVFKPMVDRVGFAVNYTFRDDWEHQDIVHEGNLYFVLRWNQFPWQDYIATSLAFGDGISYASHVPYVDKITADTGVFFRRFLNYMMVEATFALDPKSPWQVVLRLHHRCTAFGLYGHNNAGSTSVGVGLRYNF